MCSKLQTLSTCFRQQKRQSTSVKHNRSQEAQTRTSSTSLITSTDGNLQSIKDSLGRKKGGLYRCNDVGALYLSSYLKINNHPRLHQRRSYSGVRNSIQSQSRIMLKQLNAAVEALRYKPEGRGFDSRWGHWNFSVTTFWPHYGVGVDSASNRNEYQEFSWGIKAAGA